MERRGTNGFFPRSQRHSIPPFPQGELKPANKSHLAPLYPLDISGSFLHPWIFFEGACR